MLLKPFGGGYQWSPAAEMFFAPWHMLCIIWKFLYLFWILKPNMLVIVHLASYLLHPWPLWKRRCTWKNMCHVTLKSSLIDSFSCLSSHKLNGIVASYWFLCLKTTLGEESAGLSISTHTTNPVMDCSSSKFSLTWSQLFAFSSRRGLHPSVAAILGA